MHFFTANSPIILLIRNPIRGVGVRVKIHQLEQKCHPGVA